jgi:hypothetical protein
MCSDESNNRPSIGFNIACCSPRPSYQHHINQDEKKKSKKENRSRAGAVAGALVRSKREQSNKTTQRQHATRHEQHLNKVALCFGKIYL